MRELLIEVAGKYDQKRGTGAGVAGQRVLRGVEGRTDLFLPDRYFAKGYGGQGTASTCPWIGVFDPDVNTDPKEGLYLAYIFSADLSAVTLTLQQGVTKLEDRFPRRRDFLAHLENRAAELLDSLPLRLIQGWTERPSFGTGDRPKAYEAANVVGRRYPIAGLPGESDLRDDLSHAASLLQRAAAAEKLWWHEARTDLPAVEFEPGKHADAGTLDGFHPKSSRDYIANIAAKQQVKRRDHERLIADFGPHAASRGYVPITDRVHPKDLILHRGGEAREEGPEWLVEAKVVKTGNPTTAVREAVGQLKEYSYFLYQKRDQPAPYLIGLFTEDIGVYSTYLEDQGIASIWKSGGGWSGSRMAATWNMTD
ncbi:MrcB family domain-containing protein [Streptomyces sp. ISL-100]|uniref:MrcB family domain-containing protein n=1 Tax=Streptomyces sp. ISL-100 TaxID=2819173 RepID=UPI002035FA24|nr:DUF3578 domain-containing protein [Streptomyces sp. ISL-100]